MASVADPVRRSPFPSSPRSFTPTQSRALPVLSANKQTASSQGDPMDVSQAPSAPMAPPTSSAGEDRSRESHTDGQQSTTASDQQSQQDNASSNGASSQPVGAAAAAQQPKIVQTAFIHKLYNMLEDQSIQHLISWSSTNESFVMSPSSEFSRVLAQYFKHTNISSFVRQLNMYGFHKVSDVFHTGSPDSPLWEFKHGAGNFKRGDLVGLREIKRRASRHALIHRDSFPSTPKIPVPPQPTGPPMDPMPDPAEARLNVMEWHQQELYNRLNRTEEAHAAVSARCHVLLESLGRCFQWNSDLASHLLTLVPDPDNPVHRDVSAMRQDIARQMESLRSPEQTQDAIFGSKPPFFSSNAGPSDTTLPPISPRQRPFDESRRPSLQSIGRPPSFRTAVPAHMQASPRRYGSIGTGNGAYSPNANTRSNYPPALPPPPPPQAGALPQQQQHHPLSNVESTPPNLPRRHTSADIRQHGWQAGQQPPASYNHGSSPYASGQNSGAWPSSPRAPAIAGDQQIRDALAQYELPRASQMASRQASPPAPHESAPPAPSFTNSFSGGYANNSNDAGWQLPGPKYPFRGLDTPGPPTRRSSMASNVHSLLNPADTAEREGEDEGPDDRKRKRVT